MTEFYDSFPSAFVEAAGIGQQLHDVRCQQWWLRWCVDAATWTPKDRTPRVIDLDECAYVPEHDPYAWHPFLSEMNRRRAGLWRTLYERQQRHEPIVAASYRLPSDLMRSVLDWLCSLDESWLNKLPKITWQAADQHTEKWHAALARKKKDTAGDDGTHRRHDLAGGWYWVRLQTIEALDRESVAMGSCVGHGGYDQYSGGGDATVSGIWSLRQPCGRSRVTLEISYLQSLGPDGSIKHIVVQAEGPGNAGIPDDAKPFVKTIADAVGVALDIDLLDENRLHFRDQIVTALLEGGIIRVPVPPPEILMAKTFVEFVDDINTVFDPAQPAPHYREIEHRGRRRA